MGKENPEHGAARVIVHDAKDKGVPDQVHPLLNVLVVGDRGRETVSGPALDRSAA